jgi:hypothetical protein
LPLLKNDPKIVPDFKNDSNFSKHHSEIAPKRKHIKCANWVERVETTRIYVFVVRKTHCKLNPEILDVQINVDFLRKNNEFFEVAKIVEI